MEDQSPESRCHHAALRLLHYRFRGTEELRRKLAQKGHEPDAIASTLSRLADEGWLDDARFARELARSRSRKGIGPKRIRLELRELGVPDEVARAAMDDAAEEGGDRLPELVRKRIRILERRGPLDAAARKKLLAYLLNQGYEYSAAADAVESELRSSNDSNAHNI